MADEIWNDDPRLDGSGFAAIGGRSNRSRKWGCFASQVTYRSEAAAGHPLVLTGCGVSRQGLKVGPRVIPWLRQQSVW